MGVKTKGGMSSKTHRATSPAELETTVQQRIEDSARQYREVQLLDFEPPNLGWIR